MSEEKEKNSPAERKMRTPSPTMVKLGELAERLRKVLRIKEEVKSGSYKVSNEQIAEALIRKEGQI